MRHALVPFAALASVAFLLGGCEDPLEPDRDQASLGSTGTGLTAPSNLSAAAVSPSRIDLVWQDKSSNETGFKLHRSTTGPNGTFALLTTTAANVTRYSNSGLSPSTQYCYKVRAFRRIGSKTSYSAFSNTACATTPATSPLAPRNVYVRPAWSDGVIIGWSDNADNEAGYRVERSAQSTGPWVTVVIRGPMNGLHSQEASDGGLTPDLPVCYRVVAFNSTGDSPSGAHCTVPPARPTNLTAKPLDDLSVELTWMDNSAFEDGYKVLRMRSGLPGDVVATLPANASSYHETGLSGNMTYEYRVQATKDGGNSSPSEIARASLALLPPAAPSGARAFPNGSTGIAILWTDQSANDDGFRIERSTDGGLTWVFAVEGDPWSSSTSGVTDWNRTPEFEVCYRVIAWNTAGQSGPSNTSCTTPPAGPTNVTWSQIDANTAEVRWDDNSRVEDGYEMYALGTEGDWLLLASVPPNSTSAHYDLTLVPPSYSGPILAATKDGGYSDWGQ
jgi:uncharacterized protein